MSQAQVTSTAQPPAPQQNVQQPQNGGAANVKTPEQPIANGHAAPNQQQQQQQQQQMLQPQSNGSPPSVSPNTVGGGSGGNDVKDGQELRCLIENHSVGCIIGKGGANVKRVRDETGVSISILKAENVKAVKERVMVLKGATGSIAKALFMVAERLVEASNSAENKKQQQGGNDAKDEKDSAVIRLLVHRSSVGAVIGKAGAVIKETQTETNARVQVSNDPLPQSTEKTITITGTPAAIQAALNRILNQLRDNPLKNQRVIPFIPGQQLYVQPMPGQYGYPQGGPYGQQNQNGQPNPVYGAQAGAYGQQQVAPPQRQELAIPTHTAGGIIGKGGAVIRDLRAQSGTSISIADPEPNNPSERIVTVSGTAQGIQTAIYLIRQLVEQYQPPQAAGGMQQAPQQQQQGGGQQQPQQQQQQQGGAQQAPQQVQQPQQQQQQQQQQQPVQQQQMAPQQQMMAPQQQMQQPQQVYVS